MITAGIVTVAAVAFTLVSASSASAAVLTDRFQLAGTHSCLEGGIGGGISDVRLATCASGDRQLWRWSTPSTQTSLRHVGTGTCAHRLRASVGLSGCGAAVAQRWRVTGTPDNLLIRAADTGQCLGRTGAGRVGMSVCDGTAAQRWQRA
ncbi:RICIN domain-containing protein [Lentzea terrae]|uniref:RICIN domain-containing protein n=1 Tax=Lentzea terrae TaxID=2200761 RepID=UPI0013004455|nr:RICIN domain-containing protein [Lentzea terrae]